MKERIATLASLILKYKEDYYNSETGSEISDAAYDELENELKSLDPNHPVLTSIGVTANSEWKKAQHAIPMGSLDKVKNPEELVKWADEYLTNKDIFVTEKLDGLSIELIYNNGSLIRAITRGDGIEGDEITTNVLKMKGVVKTLPVPFNGSLRGEIILTNNIFSTNPFFTDYANPRNAAAGISKRLDGKGSEYLNILFYQAIGYVQERVNLFSNEFEQLQFIEKTLNLNIPNYYQLSSIDEVIRLWEAYQSKLRHDLDWDIDGLVVRINNLKEQQKWGDLHLRPRGAIAFKFKAESAISKVLQIQLQVGNSGRITPIVEIEPVQLVGVQVTRASLYNFAYINKLGLDVGAKVVIVRANDVIPRCETVLEQTETVFQPPTNCPTCNGMVLMVGENLQCINTDTCPAQIIGRFKNWINALNIMEWGEKLLVKLVDQELIEKIPDLYKLSVKDLSSLERMGEKSAQKCYDTLWSHNPISLDVFLGGLSIPMVGISTVQLIINAGLDSFEKIISCTENDFLKIKGLGQTKAKSLYNGLRRNHNLIEELFNLGIRISESKSVSEGILSEKIFCITGPTFLKRDELAKIIIAKGGIYKNNITKDCTHLIVADTSKISKKINDALKLGIEIISEEQFQKLIS